MNLTDQDQQFSLTLSPEPFCTFCLRENPANVDFYKYVTGGFDELRLSFESILGYDFQLDNFAICKPCWSLVQLFQDFRTCCQRANGLVERIGRGVGSGGDDGWFGEKNVGLIEGIQRMVQHQLTKIKGIDDVGMIKIEPVELEEMACSDDVGEESKTAGCSQQLTLRKTQDDQPPKFHMVEIKVDDRNEEDTDECNDDSSSYEGIEENSVATKPTHDLPGEIEVDVHQASIEHNEMETQSEEDEETDNTSVAKCRRSGLLKCKKCQRKFDKLRGIKLHLINCKGTTALSFLTCYICKATFTDPRLLQTHINKHEGKTPFQCRKSCTASFASVQIRNRHEDSCNKHRWKCTLCQEHPSTQNRLFEHYRLAHPGELRYPCSACGKRFKRRSALKSHERRIHSEHRVKTETCLICDKKFAEIEDLKGHIKSIHGSSQGKPSKTISCEKCGKQFRRQHSLNIHMAARHPEDTTAENLKAYEQKLQHNMVRKRKKKAEAEKSEEKEAIEFEVKHEVKI